MTNPTNELYLLSNVDLDPDYNYTLDFDNETAQHAYFENKVANVLLHTDDYSYIRADQSIKVYANIDTLNSVNYLMYKNADKWYYGFITKKEYVSDNVSRLIFKIDPLQTFMFDYSLEESFIDREHQDRWTSDGKPIYNIIDEELELGKDYNIKTIKQFNSVSGIDKGFKMWYIILAKEPLGTRSGTNTFTEYYIEETGLNASTTTGLYVYILPCTEQGTAKLANKDGSAVYAGNFQWKDAIIEDPRVISISQTRYIGKVFVNMQNAHYMIGSRFDGTSDYDAEAITYDKDNTLSLLLIRRITKNEICRFKFEESFTPDLDINKAPNIENETKLKTYPFTSYRLRLGDTIKEFRKEYFNGDIEFAYLHSFMQNGNIDLIPINYNGASKALFDKMQIVNSFEVPLRTDAWNNYMLQNKASINGGLVVKTGQFLGNIATELATGKVFAGVSAISFAGDIFNNILKRQDLKNTPDDIKPTATDTLIQTYETTLYASIEKIEIKDTYKQIAFKYLMHYGYKCNDFKKPNVRSRYYFNYIKTIGANIKTNIDADYKNEIASIFDKGITIWHYRDATTFKGVNNFEYENAEISIIGGTNGN